METKHTPGPWHIDNRIKTSINSDKKHIAMVNYYNHGEHPMSTEEHNANAKLIAAAPAMFEALIKMCEWHEKQATWDKGDNGYYQAKQIINNHTK